MINTKTYLNVQQSLFMQTMTEIPIYEDWFIDTNIKVKIVYK